MQPIYLDHAATTPADRENILAAMPYFGEVYFNPSSAHSGGQAAFTAVEKARRQCAALINCDPSEIVFTSGGTEAVCLGLSAAKNTGKNRVIVSAIEHESAIEYSKTLESVGFTVEYLKPNRLGVITPESLEAVMSDDVALVCVMTVNNIVGTLQPVKRLACVAKSRGALFFTDAVQAVNSVRLDVQDIGADLVAVSAHKFYAPKGAGFLYVRRGVSVCPQLVGGSQEAGRRAGTLNVPAIVAMGEAAFRAAAFRDDYIRITSKARAEFLKELKSGEPLETGEASPDIASVRFDADAGRLFVALSVAGVYCSVGAACAAGSATPPRTLIEMQAQNADKILRFSFGKYTDVASAQAAAGIVNEVAARLSK